MSLNFCSSLIHLLNESNSSCVYISQAWAIYEQFNSFTTLGDNIYIYISFNPTLF